VPIPALVGRQPREGQVVRSNLRYWIASATCAAATALAPVRSAIVRATLSTR